MTQKQWRKLDALEHVVNEKWTMDMGATAAGVCVRHFRRLRRQYESAEDKTTVGVHGNAGRSPPNRISSKIRKKVVELRKKKYAGFNDTHFREKLVEKHKITVSRQTIQRILRQENIPSPQGRKTSRRFERRQRRSRKGWMLLWDGSLHDWLEGRGQPMCLMGAIDDATGRILKGAHFVERECSGGYLRLLHEMVRHHGVPLEIYADRHSALKRNDKHWSLEEELAGRQNPTQVGRAAQSLGIQFIWAQTPQAKGRIERAWKTFQDRFISELRLENVTTLKEANRLLEIYRCEHNRRFCKEPANPTPAWRPGPEEQKLKEICSFHVMAKARKDSTVKYQGQVYDLKGPSRASIAGRNVEIHHLLTGKLRMYIHGKLVCTAKGKIPTKAPEKYHNKPPSAATS